jgi:hypothetical protein
MLILKFFGEGHGNNLAHPFSFRYLLVAGLARIENFRNSRCGAAAVAGYRGFSGGSQVPKRDWCHSLLI